MWFWMTDCILLQHVLEYPRKWCAYSTVWLLQHRCQVPIFVHISCIPYKHAPVYSHFIKTYICSVYVFSCNLPPALWAEWPGSFTCCGNTGRNRYQSKSQHSKLTPEKKIHPPHLQGLQSATFQPWVQCSTTELSLLNILLHHLKIQLAKSQAKYWTTALDTKKMQSSQKQ